MCWSGARRSSATGRCGATRRRARRNSPGSSWRRAPGARGRGLGRRLVRGLAEQALRAGYTEIFMRVHPANTTALRCYRGAGFLPVDPALAAQWNIPQPVGYVWLRHAGAGA
ncbi:GNAT family N-acetyltransferase [Streptomyces sp. NPDC054855]